MYISFLNINYSPMTKILSYYMVPRLYFGVSRVVAWLVVFVQLGFEGFYYIRGKSGQLVVFP